jgi:glycyl-tRNA synthetase
MNSTKQFSLETIVSWAKRKWFVYPNSDIYGGLANAWDYGPYGAVLKKNISDLWVKHFTADRDDVVYMDTAIIAHPTTWVASGHVGSFADALIDDRNTGQRFRADKIIEAYFEKVRDGLSDEDLATKLWQPNLSPESWWNDGMYQFIIKYIPNNPDKPKEKADWTECRNFNLMLDTHLWPVADDANKVYMRPETCQSLFTDFKMVCDTTRNRIPFGLAQIGKAFRNEITPGQFLFRTREFEQMEIEYFVPADPDEAMKFFDQWKADSWEYWTQVIGINPEHLRFKDHDKLAHYAAAATDVEYAFPWWYGEVQWVHNRTNFDLTQHQEHSGNNMQYIDPKTGARYIPWCVEASWGLGRQTMVAMLEFYDEEILTKENSDGTTTEDTRIVVRFPFALAPVKFAVLPLLEKSDEMVAKARSLQKILRQAGYTCEYDASGGIGKRYRRQDEIGTPYCVTIDHQTLEDDTVTVRDRDTMQQLGEGGRMTLEQLIMLEINIIGDNCGDGCDCGHDHIEEKHKPQEKVCCGGGCGCH